MVTSSTPILKIPGDNSAFRKVLPPQQSVKDNPYTKWARGILAYPPEPTTMHSLPLTGKRKIEQMQCRSTHVGASKKLKTPETSSEVSGLPELTDYTLLSPVSGTAEGLTAKVWKVKDKTGAIYAAKIYKQLFKAAFNEFDLYKRTEGFPHALQLHPAQSLGRIGNKPALITEFIPDRDLFHYAGKLSLRRVCSITSQALSYLQSMQLIEPKIVHKDIKPDNLLYKYKSDHLTVCDLGFGQLLPLPTSPRSQSAPGSVLAGIFQVANYRAPEVMLDNQFGPPIDMWSLGVTLFALVTDSHLFPIEETEINFKNLNYLLNLMVRRLGMPSSDALKDLARKQHYFIGDKLKHPVIIPFFLKSWKTEIREVFADESKEIVEQFITLLDGMLQFNPKDRITPDQGLNNPLFAKQVSFCITLPDPSMRAHTLFVHEIITGHGLQAVLEVDLSLSPGSLRCLHLPSKDQAYVFTVYEKESQALKFRKKIQFERHSELVFKKNKINQWELESQGGVP